MSVQVTDMQFQPVWSDRLRQRPCAFDAEPPELRLHNSHFPELLPVETGGNSVTDRLESPSTEIFDAPKQNWGVWSKVRHLHWIRDTSRKLFQGLIVFYTVYLGTGLYFEP
jgi:hypothetical protein